MEVARDYLHRWKELPQPRKVKALHYVAAASYLMFAFLFVIYAFSGIHHAERRLDSTIVFIDYTPDALQSLAFLLQRKDVEVSMIVVGSRSWALNALEGAAMVKGFLKALRVEKNISKEVPVYYGSSFAFADSSFSVNVDFAEGSAEPSACTYCRVLSPAQHFEAERMYGVDSELVKFYESSSVGSLAVQYYESPLDTLLEKTSVQFLVLGTGSDAALFLQTVPSRQGKVTSLTIAGGAIQSAGNAQYVFPSNQRAELNFFFDPQAANYLVSGIHTIPVTVVTLDAAPLWSDKYNLYVDSTSFGENIFNSGSITGASIARFYERFPGIAQRVSVNLLTAVFFADTSLQSASVVSIFPMAVLSSQNDLSTSGAVLNYPLSPQNSTVVISLDESVFWRAWPATL